MDFDYDTYTTVRKALLIGHIIAIALANLIFFIKVFRARDPLMKSPRRWLLTTLSFGDLLLAFFSLVIMARVEFKDYNHLANCAQTVLSVNYSGNFLPFVYGISLITLCGEIMKRKQIQAWFSCPYHASILIAALPWISALVVILPLTLAGTGYTECRYEMTLGRSRAVVILSRLLPAIFALVMAFVSRSNLTHPSSDVYDMTATPSCGGTVLTTRAQQPTAPPASNPTDPKAMAAPPPTYGDVIQTQQQPPYPQQQPPYPQQQPFNPQPQYQQPPYPQPQYPQPQYPQPPYPQPQYPQPTNQQPQYISQYQQPPAFAAATVGPDQQTVANSVATEHRAIIRVALMHFVMLFPSVMYTLFYQLNEDRADLDIEFNLYLSLVVEFLVYSRSFLTPIVWSLSIN